MKNDDEVRLLEEFANILEKQVELARHGGFTEAQDLVGQCEPFVVKMIAAGLLERPEYMAWRERLTKLHRDLQMAISMQKDATGEQLKSIRKHKKTLATYRGSI